MDPARLSVTIRPRTPWEGVDLGFAMARHWFVPLWLLWLSLALPLYGLVALLVTDRPWLVILLVWWFKPLFEPMLLFWLSRALFDEALPVGEAWRSALAVLPGQLLQNLTWRRFNPNRSFNMPVAVLEQLKGREHKNRIRVLGRGQHAGTWLTLVGVHFEMLLEVSFLVLLVLLLPEELGWLEFETLLLQPGVLEEWLQHAGTLLAMSLIAPFYVAGGFALYLTRRSELEAWDIEIAFRRLVTRGRPQASKYPAMAAGLVMVASLLLPGFVHDLEAAEIDRERAAETIRQVLADDDFGKWTEQAFWKYAGDKDQESGGISWLIDLVLEFLEGFARGIAAVSEGILWVGGGLLLALLVHRLIKNRDWLQKTEAGRSGRGGSPAALFGMALEPESLPDDVAAEVNRLLKAGQFRPALSLLYRGALVRLVHDHRLEIPGSATEGECLRLVREERPEQESALFERLTLHWVRLAYAHLPPSEEALRALCSDWNEVFQRGGRNAT